MEPFELSRTRRLVEDLFEVGGKNEQWMQAASGAYHISLRPSEAKAE